MTDEKLLRTTTFQLSRHMHTQMRIMCALTEKNMGEFIRIAIADKITQIRSNPSFNEDTFRRD